MSNITKISLSIALLLITVICPFDYILGWVSMKWFFAGALATWGIGFIGLLWRKV
jgi:hypothetical protein